MILSSITSSSTVNSFLPFRLLAFAKASFFPALSLSLLSQRKFSKEPIVTLSFTVLLHGSVPLLNIPIHLFFISTVMFSQAHLCPSSLLILLPSCLTYVYFLPLCSIAFQYWISCFILCLFLSFLFRARVGADVRTKGHLLASCLLVL